MAGVPSSGGCRAGKTAQLVFMPAAWIVRHDPQRFGLLHEITQFHGAYNSSKARRDVPEFVCEVDLTSGAAETFTDLRRRESGGTPGRIRSTSQ